MSNAHTEKTGTAMQTRGQVSLDHLRTQAEAVLNKGRDAMREAIILRVENERIRQRVASGQSAKARSREMPGRGSFTPKSLTPRERGVLELVVKGKSTREIASQLRIAFKTAACHRSSIMGKLAVHNSAALVREAYRLGFVNE